MAWVVLIVLVGLLIWWASKREKKLVAKLQAEAQAMGFTYEGSGDPFRDAPVDAGGFSLFTHGDQRRIQHLLRGSAEGLDTVIFDYTYTVSGGGADDSDQSYTQTVMAFRMPGSGLPQMHVQKTNFALKVGSKLGYRRVEFPEHDEFNKKYFVRGPQEDAIRQFFSPDLVSYFENGYDATLVLDLNGDWVLVYRDHSRVTASELRNALQLRLQVAQHMRQYRARAAGA